MRLSLAVALVTCATAQPASAIKFVFEVRGTIGSIESYEITQNRKVDRPVSFQTGDSFSNTIVYDSVEFESLDDFNALSDPTKGYYLGSVLSNTIIIGNYTAVSAPGEKGLAFIRIYNDYGAIPAYPELTPFDEFALYAERTVFGGSSPVDFGNTGPVLAGTSYGATDKTSTARTSDLLTDVTPFSGFQIFQGMGTFIDESENSTEYTFNTTSMNIKPLSAVPEPATWAMMLLGFGMTGAAMRYRRRATKVTYA